MRRLLLALGALVLLAVVLAFMALPRWVDYDLNRVIAGAPIEISPHAQSLHARLRIADMHDDLLLWSLRDPVTRHSRGHTDVPRLLEGNVALQIFSTVSKTPKNQNYDSNTGDTDNITLLAITQRWPMASWSSLFERARRTATSLDAAAARSNGALRVVRSQSELQQGLDAREREGRVLLGVLSLEGMQVAGGRVDLVDSLFALGFRMGGLTHFFDNEVGGSAHGVSKAGLTPFGRETVVRIEQLGMLVDVAHASPRLIDDVLAIATRPVVVSHTGVQGTCAGVRNLSDDHLRRIAATGGVVAIGYWDAAVCDITPASIARAILYAVNVAGPDHVALGSDWDGAVTTSFDATALVRITNALLDAGMSEAVIAQVMGENLLRLLSQTLPPS